VDSRTPLSGVERGYGIYGYDEFTHTGVMVMHPALHFFGSANAHYTWTAKYNSILKTVTFVPNNYNAVNIIMSDVTVSTQSQAQLQLKPTVTQVLPYSNPQSAPAPTPTDPKTLLKLNAYTTPLSPFYRNPTDTSDITFADRFVANFYPQPSPTHGVSTIIIICLLLICFFIVFTLKKRMVKCTSHVFLKL
jgi:hypothetical protein